MGKAIPFNDPGWHSSEELGIYNFLAPISYHEICLFLELLKKIVFFVKYLLQIPRNKN